MTIFESIILGVVQGATEFIPVSSSGHLIIVRDLLGMSTGGLAFDAVLQLATSLAIVVYFRKDFLALLNSCVKLFGRQSNTVKRSQRGFIYALVVGTIPAIILGLLLEDRMETVFRSSELVILTLVVGALLIWIAELYSQKKFGDTIPKLPDITTKKGFWIGIFQSLALVPGMSRSGSTLSGGLFMGLDREEATRFAFMLGAPILLGSGVKKLLELGSSGGFADVGIQLLLGSITAFVVGLWAMDFLIKYLKNKTLMPFVMYRLLLSFVLILSI